ncbi:MAG: hypothetical protein WD008_04135 [Balneolaceae bacterium]
MSAFIWVLIPLVAILGGYIIDYQKNKLRWQAKNTKYDEEVGELRKLIQQMKKRIENLEAIAANDPSEFDKDSADPLHRIEVDDSEGIKDENQKNVANMVKSKGK